MKKHKFVFRFWPTIITFLMLIVLLGLGTWQVQRLHWKEDLISKINDRVKDDPVTISEALKSGDAEYRPAKTTGFLRNDHEFYVASISTTGEGGYRVLTPLKLDSGKYLLVDRGWVPYDKKLPATRAAGQVAGTVRVGGILRASQHVWSQPANDAANNVWYWIDLPTMAKIAGVPEFLPYVLEADTRPNPGGYPIGGQTRIVLINNHLSYALTWYGLALALLVIYGVSGYRKVS